MIGTFFVEVEEIHYWPSSRTQPPRKEYALLVADMARTAEHAIQGVCKLLLNEDDARAHWGTLKGKTVTIAVTKIAMGGSVPVLRGQILKVPPALENQG